MARTQEQEIKDLFGDKFEKEAEIITKIIKKHHWTIATCGTPTIDFAVYCKNEIEKHYQTFPQEGFTGIDFKEENQGFDNWIVTPQFKYVKNKDKDGEIVAVKTKLDNKPILSNINNDTQNRNCQLL